jgi:hypothetical protein
MAWFNRAKCAEIKPQKLAKIVTQKLIYGILSLNEQGFMIEKNIG